MSRHKIYFRADASTEIGFGHFIRSLALADILKNDFDITFFTTAPNEYQISELNNVCSYVPLSTKTNNEDFLYNLHGNEIVVLDNYFYSTSYQVAIKNKGCILVCIDDPHKTHYVCDVLISHGFCKETDFDSKARIKCIGPQWALLRAPFLQKTERNAQRKKQIIVNIGGADPFNIMEHVLEELLKSNLPHKIVAIVGKATVLSDNIMKKVDCRRELTAQQMVELFSKSSFGLLPASTICIEALSCKLPLLVGHYVDNQLVTYREMKRMKIVVPIGDLQKVTSEVLSDAIEQLKDIRPYAIQTEKIKENYISVFKSL